MPIKRVHHLSFIFSILLFVLISSSSARIDKTKHHNHEEMLEVMYETKRRCPEITYIYNLTGPSNTTEKGRRLTVIVLSSYPERHQIGIPEFRYVANIHGNEVVGRELLLYLMEFICDEYKDGKEGIIALLQRTRIHLLPSMNPDGWQTAYENLLEDKKDYQDLLGRENSQGIDLNRNFPNLDAILFKGFNNGKNNHLMDAFFKLHMEESENESKKVWAAETMMVMKWILTGSFVLSANLHGGELVINYPFDTYPNGSLDHYSATPDDALFRHLASKYADNHRRMTIPRDVCRNGGVKFFEQGGITNGADWYKVVGGMQDFNYLASNCFELTFELGCDKFPDSDRLLFYWNDNREALIKFIWMTHMGVKGRILDASTNQGIADAVIMVTRANGSYIDHDVTSAKDGDYWRLLNDGLYSLKACSEPKYHCSRRFVRVRNQPYGSAQIFNFRLERKEDDENLQKEEVDELRSLNTKLETLAGA